MEEDYEETSRKKIMKATSTQTLVVFALAGLAVATIPGTFLNASQHWRILSASLTAILLILDIGVLISLPHTLVGFILGVWYGFGRVTWSGRALEVTSRRASLIGGPWVGAQTHGIIIFYRDERARSYEPLRAHEHVHVEQGRQLGPIYVLAYVLHFCFNLIRYRNYYKAYRNIYFEKKAREIAGH